MSRYDLSHLPDHVIVRQLRALAATDWQTTADMLAYIAESDTRRLYAADGFASLYDWCVEELKFSEDQASKRIHAARAARRFPVIFERVADGRLTLSAVVLLALAIWSARRPELPRRLDRMRSRLSTTVRQFEKRNSAS